MSSEVYLGEVDCLRIEALTCAIEQLTAVLSESTNSSYNSATVPCNQYMKQSSVVSMCPIGHFNCGASPCMVTQHQ